MKIIQVLATAAYGDGIGNEAMALYYAILNMGYQTGIYAENIDSRYNKKIVQHISQLSELEDEDVILYHLSTGTSLNYDISSFGGRKIVIYHNITPPMYFKDYDSDAFQLVSFGLEGMKHLAGTAEYCLADSTFNKQDLLRAGYTCKIDILPILVQFMDYEATPNSKIIDRYLEDGYVNLLFTGRIAPNKKQEDIIRIFYQYHKNYNPKSRLFLVGAGMERYDKRLKDYVAGLGLEEVYFTGHIKFDELLAYYKIADIFVCMSEHEGFCIPLVEAMYFNIPILAYNSSAIGETLGGSGFLTETKDPVINASILNRILTDKKLNQVLINNEKERLNDLSYSMVMKKFEKYIKMFIGEKDEE